MKKTIKNKTKVCIKEDCKNRGKALSWIRFHKGQRICKSCHSKNVQEAKEVRINKLLEEMLVSTGLITIVEMSAANLLYRSCVRAITSTTKKYDKKYEDISCVWGCPHIMIIDLITKLPDFWTAWKQQSVIYFASGKKLSLRPSIDRINPCGDYTFSNIQMLSHGENAKKARVKPIKVTIVEDGKNVELIHCGSVKEVVETLGIKFPISAFIDNGQGYDIGNGKVAVFSVERNIDKTRGMRQKLKK